MEQSSERLPLVSIVIPVYNMEEYLEETLCSVLASTYPHIEVILMDDGSKDSSLCIAEKFAAQYENVYAYSQPNGGVAVARNQAIVFSRGEYIYPLDADDLLDPDFILLAVHTMNEDNNIKVVCSEDYYIGEKNGPWRVPEYSIQLLARKNMIAISALYRKIDWIRVGGYCENIIAREDWDFWISILKNGGRVIGRAHV